MAWNDHRLTIVYDCPDCSFEGRWAMEGGDGALRVSLDDAQRQLLAHLAWHEKERGPHRPVEDATKMASWTQTFVDPRKAGSP